IFELLVGFRPDLIHSRANCRFSWIHRNPLTKVRHWDGWRWWRRIGKRRNAGHFFLWCRKDRPPAIKCVHPAASFGMLKNSLAGKCHVDADAVRVTIMNPVVVVY